jgi:hypothetical protein
MQSECYHIKHFRKSELLKITFSRTTASDYLVTQPSYFLCARDKHFNICDQKLASDSSGLPGGFSGQRAWVRIFKKWAPGSYCLELVVACPAAGTSAQILLVEGK